MEKASKHKIEEIILQDPCMLKISNLLHLSDTQSICSAEHEFLKSKEDGND